MERVVAAMTMVAAFAGCISETATLDPAAPAVQGGSRIPVIAILDTGATPYLGIFEEPHPDYVRENLRADFTTVTITPGGTAKDDTEMWSSLQPFKLYHYAGTRLLGISVAPKSFAVDQTRDNAGHGTGTTLLAAREAPDAIIVSVQMNGTYCALDASFDCLVEGSIASGMEWIAEQEWVDIVSISIGIPANLPDTHEAHPEAARFIAASRAAAQRGKLIVNSAGNDPTVSLADYFDSPPWVISVGGHEPERHGNAITASKGADVAANFTEFVPTGDDNVSEWRHGTSFATPIVAGTLASALAEVWRVDPTREVSPQELRDALNASALAWQPTDWDPSPIVRDGLPDTSSTNLPILHPAQSGWGYVDASLAPEIARRILTNDYAIPAEKEEIAQWQAQWQGAREAYWDARE